jgi:hypothetical protein
MMTGAMLRDIVATAGIVLGAHACGELCTSVGHVTTLVIVDAVTLDPVCSAEVRSGGRQSNYSPFGDCHAVGDLPIGASNREVEISAPGYRTRSFVVSPLDRDEDCPQGGGCNIVLLDPDGST